MNTSKQNDSHAEDFAAGRRDQALYNSCQRDSMAKREALEAPAGTLTREELRALGFRAMSKSSDLLPWGYQVVVWFSPRVARQGGEAVVYEYAPVDLDGTHARRRHNLGVELPRLTAATIEEQLAVHELVGAPIDECCDTQQELF